MVSKNAPAIIESKENFFRLEVICCA